MLAKEITFLAELRHPGIVQILYHAKCTSPNYPGGMPFYLMEAVDGTRSDRYVRLLVAAVTKDRNERSTAEFEERLVAMLRAVLDAIRYLHAHPSGARVHLDIKPENIIVRSNGQPVVIDLGTCKRVLVEKDKTVVACTLSMAAPSLVRRLRTDPTDKNRAGGELARDEIRPHWDLWAFAASMLRWLTIDPSNGSNGKEPACDLLLPYTRKYLILLAARFMANESVDDIPSWFTTRIGLSQSILRDMHVSSAFDGIELLDRLTGTSNPIERVPEMNVRAVTTLQSAEGVHLPLTKALTAILEHRVIRRLESIAQLGMVVEVYPEARHTRKEHSLGTYGWTIQYIKALYSDPVSPLFKQWITEDDCRDLALAALLHDIGHFPLAHDLEDIDSDLFNHSDLTAAWLGGSYRKLGVDKQQVDSLGEVVRNFGSSVERVGAILAARANLTSGAIAPKSKLLRSIISGPIDADKIDYLLRDGDRMRLPYPRGIDVDRVLRSLTTVVVDKVDGGARDVPLIAVHAKGKVAAEFISIVRYAMFSQGYWHHTVRAIKAMLARAVRALTGRALGPARLDLQRRFHEFVFSLPESLFPGTGEQGLVIMTRPRPPVAALSEVPQLATSDVAVLRWLESELAGQDRPERSLISGILNRRLYKRLWVVSRDMQERRWDTIAKKWSALKREQKTQVSASLERRVSRKLRDATKQ
jgi:serine/threonine protein kinase